MVAKESQKYRNMMNFTMQTEKEEERGFLEEVRCKLRPREKAREQLCAEAAKQQGLSSGWCYLHYGSGAHAHLMALPTTDCVT